MKLFRLSITINFTKMKEDNISQFGDYDGHSVNNNTAMGLVISLCSNSNHLMSLIPPKLPQILDIYSVVAPQYHEFFPLDFRSDPKIGILSQLSHLVVTELPKFFLLFDELC